MDFLTNYELLQVWIITSMNCFPGSVQMLQLSGTMKNMTALYEQAGKTAAEGIENMRTVASLCLENTFSKKYAESLSAPTRLSGH